MLVRFLPREGGCQRFPTLNAIVLRRLGRAALACVRAGGIGGQPGSTNGICDTVRWRSLIDRVGISENLIR